MKLGYRTISATALAMCLITNVHGQATAEDHNRLYLSLSGLWVQQDDADFEVDDEPLTADTEIEFDDGFGVVVAIGQEIADSPFRLEFEYAYRQAESEGISGSLIGDQDIDVDIETQSFMLNGLIDFRLGDGPIGFYAGAGIGVAVTRFDHRSLFGTEYRWSEHGTSFCYQGLAGVTFDLSENAQIFGGVRYFDALESEIVNIEIENKSINFEAGLRFFF